MPKWASDLGANCAACPLGLQSTAGVPAEGARPSRFTIISDHPGRTEEVMGRPFVGVTGAMVNDALESFGLEREDCYLTHTVKCRPHRKLTGGEWKQARAACRPLLQQELAENTAVIAMGKETMAELAGKSNMHDWRGWPLPGVEATKKEAGYPHLQVWPMEDPKELWKTPANLPVWLQDFQRGLAFADGNLPAWEWPREIISVGPALIEFLQAVRDRKLTIAVDTEGTGLDPLTAKVTVIGLAAWEDGKILASAAIAWPTPSTEVDTLVREILASPEIPKVLQNAMYDWIALEAHGIPFEGIVWDTLYAGCIIAPQIKHDLGQQANVAVGGNRWKSEFRVGGDAKGAARFARADQHDLLVYNARDCSGTLLLWNWQRQALRDIPRGGERLEQMMALGRLGKRMKARGMLVDAKARMDHLTKLSEEVRAASAEFYSLAAGVTNWQSPPQLHKFFFEDNGVQPTQFDRETGKPQLNAVALGDIAVGYPGTVPGRAAIALHWLRERAKLLSTYVLELPVGLDGCVHPWWKFFTVTGRWSSAEPNMQNVPKPSKRKGADGLERERPGMRDMFIARPGLWLVSADYSQLELRILALLSGDKPLLDLFAAGGDVHDANCEALFGIRKSEWDPEDFSRKRDLGKRFVYGMLYGASDKTIHRSIVVNFPDFTLEAVEEMRANWAEAHPQIAAWQATILEIGHREKYVEAPLSGRRYRFYLGRVEPTVCANFPLQSTAADLMNKVILILDDLLDPANERIILQVHDDIVCEGPDPEVLRMKMVQAMSTAVTLNGVSISFPVDIKKGQCWGWLKKFA